jgi:predicted DNA-binding protein YlxM (UPF0122 family)
MSDLYAIPDFDTPRQAAVIEVPLDQVVYRVDLYPRIKADVATIQRYAENLDVLPAIEVNQNGILIDGFHRWTAHRKMEAPTIRVFVTETASEAEVYALAIQRNAAHGLQMNDADKRTAAIRLYADGTGIPKKEIAVLLSVSLRSVNTYLERIDQQLLIDRKAKILELWLRCYTQDEIAQSMNRPQQTVADHVKELPNLEAFPNSVKVAASFQDTDFTPPLYNVWPFRKEKTNEVNHFGNSEVGIVENLLYLYTEPFDIVLDPFAGGGSTIDICQKRLRRCYASDRKPIVERENDIRQLDIAVGLPALNKRWSEVTLTYLDPPYWKQAEGQYSDDAEDLANMSLARFSEALEGVVERIAEKQSHGVIALLMQPTQWKADEHAFTDHVTHLLCGVRSKHLVLENRISCPYQTQQYNAQQVDWAKANHKLLVLTRELIVWRVIP